MLADVGHRLPRTYRSTLAGMGQALVATVLCFLWFALVNTACYKLRHPQHTKYRFAASEIGGHITAFAGISSLFLLVVVDWGSEFVDR